MKSKQKNFSYLFLLATVISLNSWAQPTREIDFQPLSQEMLNNPEPEDWLMWRGGYENWGYSPLEQIDRENVGELPTLRATRFEFKTIGVSQASVR